MDVCWFDCEGVGEGKFLKDPGCLADCFPADHCLTSLVRDFRGVCPGSYPSKYYPQLWFTSDTSCSFLEEGDLDFSTSDPYQIKRGLCSSETEALLLDQENCVQPLLSQRDDILNSVDHLIRSTCSWQSWQAWSANIRTSTTEPSVLLTLTPTPLNTFNYLPFQSNVDWPTFPKWAGPFQLN